MNIVAPCGFVYVATGECYRGEAAVAAAQLRRTNPGARICLIADRAEGPVFWDDFVLLDRPAFGFRDKLAMHLCPYDRFVFLDTDTYVGADLTEVFQLLDHFDVAGHQLFEGHDYRLPDVPDAFPEFQGGMLDYEGHVVGDDGATDGFADLNLGFVFPEIAAAHQNGAAEGLDGVETFIFMIPLNKGAIAEAD